MTCQEPGCGMSASDEYNGMQLCRSHIDHYKYQLEQMEYELKEWN